MRRRHWLVAVALFASGCSSSSTGTKRKSGKMSGRQRMNRGPQTFSNLLVDGYIDDLKNGSADKKVKAAHELGNMGSEAKSALPMLEKLSADKNPKISAAAKSAVSSIRKR